MNTKFFFLLTAALLISNTTSSLVGSRKEITTTEISHNKDEVSPAKESSLQLDLPVDLHAENSLPKKVHKPNSDDDGKHHHFHFSRLGFKARRRVLLVMVCKVILTVAHIASFIYCFQHAFH